MDVPERRCFNGYLGNRCLHAAFQVFFRFFAGSFATIKQIEEQRFVRYINHVDIVNVDSLYNTAASSGALEAQAYVCAEESTVCYIDVFYAAGHFTAYNEAAMAVQYCVILYDNILARFTAFTSVLVFAGFDTDGIVTGIEYIIDYQRILAGFQI